MSEVTQKLGQQFIDQRLEKKLSLKEVESATSIRIAYLEAIEQGAMEKLISPIYAQGFVKQYATFLGLDADKIISENSEIFRKPIQQEFSYGIGTLESRNHPGTGVKGVSQYLWILAIVGLGIAAYFFAQFLELI